MANNNTGENIKKRRLELGLTQSELAQRMGYKHKSTIAKIEHGINDINRDTLERYAIALNTNIETLLGIKNIEIKERIDHPTFEKYRAEILGLMNELEEQPPTSEEVQLIKQYRRLSEYDRKIVDMLLNKGTPE